MPATIEPVTTSCWNQTRTVSSGVIETKVKSPRGGVTNTGVIR